MVAVVGPVASISRRNRNPRNATSLASAATTSERIDTIVPPHTGPAHENCGCSVPPITIGTTATRAAAHPITAPRAHSARAVARAGSAFARRTLPCRVPIQFSVVKPTSSRNSRNRFTRRSCPAALHPQRLAIPSAPRNATACAASSHSTPVTKSARCSERGVGVGGTEEDTRAQTPSARPATGSGRRIKLRNVAELRVPRLQELLDRNRAQLAERLLQAFAEKSGRPLRIILRSTIRLHDHVVDAA